MQEFDCPECKKEEMEKLERKVFFDRSGEAISSMSTEAEKSGYFVESKVFRSMSIVMQAFSYPTLASLEEAVMELGFVVSRLTVLLEDLRFKKRFRDEVNILFNKASDMTSAVATTRADMLMKMLGVNGVSGEREYFSDLIEILSSLPKKDDVKH